jgi:hypothetical protein
MPNADCNSCMPHAPIVVPRGKLPARRMIV